MRVALALPVHSALRPLDRGAGLALVRPVVVSVVVVSAFRHVILQAVGESSEAAYPPLAGGKPAGGFPSRGGGHRHEAMPNLTAEIANLWKQGLSAQEIADRLDIPFEVVAEAIGAAAPEELEGRDRTVADSFPASDAPPGPGA